MNHYVTPYFVSVFELGLAMSALPTIESLVYLFYVILQTIETIENFATVLTGFGWKLFVIARMIFYIAELATVYANVSSCVFVFVLRSNWIHNRIFRIYLLIKSQLAEPSSPLR